MTNKELIKELQKFPETDEVDFMVFSRLTIIRGNIRNNDIMIKRNRFDNRTCIMLNLPQYFENDITEEVQKRINQNDN